MVAETAISPGGNRYAFTTTDPPTMEANGVGTAIFTSSTAPGDSLRALERVV